MYQYGYGAALGRALRYAPRWGFCPVKLLVLALIVAFAVFWSLTDEVPRGPGEAVAGEPSQIPSNRSPFRSGNYEITPLATFSMRGRVLATERYWFDRASGISPIDLVLGWGPMSDSAVLSHFSIYQGSRWYYWRARGPQVLTVPEVVLHSANMHMIPADNSIRRTLMDLRKGNIVELSGFLVSVHAEDGWQWTSSLTRTDSGAGACELVWVQKLAMR